MLKLGGYINILIAIAHVVLLLWADTFFEVTGVGDNMREYSNIHILLPYAITVVSAVIFFIFGLYGLSGEGVIRKLPLLKLGIFSIGGIYVARAIIGLVINVTVSPFLIHHLLFSLCALAIGLLYVLGGIKRFK